MPKRRLDDRIRELCNQVRADTGAAQGIEEPLQELRAAIHEKVQKLRALAAQKLLARSTQPENQPERRAYIFRR